MLVRVAVPGAGLAPAAEGVAPRDRVGEGAPDTDEEAPLRRELLKTARRDY